MVQKAKPNRQIEYEPKATDGAEPSEARLTLPSPSVTHPTHPDPERERLLTSILVNAWPKIKSSMHYLRDR